RGGERARIGRVLLERAQREHAELLRRVRFEELRTAVNRVHRLASGGVAGKTFGKSGQRRIERRGGAADVVVGECRHRLRMIAAAIQPAMTSPPRMAQLYGLP